MNITCEQCERTYNGPQNLRRRPAPALGDDVTDIYLLCPHCGLEHHTHYVNREITRLQRLVQTKLARFQQKPTPENEAAWRKAVANLQPVFDELNPPKGRDGKGLTDDAKS